MEGKKILIIEDDQDNAFLITEELELECIEDEVIFKRDGQEAMQYLDEINENADDGTISQIELILLDLELPKVNGMEILKYLKKSKRLQSIPVVMMSTISDQETIDKAYKNGVNGFMVKSISNYDGEFVKNVKLLRDYYKSSLIEECDNKISKEAKFAVKCRDLMVNTVERVRRLSDLATEISNESYSNQTDRNTSKQV